MRSKSSNNAINFISIVAAIGVVLGAASLFIVLSGFAGLKDFTLQFSSIVDPDLKAEAAIGKSFKLTDANIPMKVPFKLTGDSIPMTAP